VEQSRKVEFLFWFGVDKVPLLFVLFCPPQTGDISHVMSTDRQRGGEDGDRFCHDAAASETVVSAWDLEGNEGFIKTGMAESWNLPACAAI